MQVDQTTLADLAIFHADEQQSVLNALNFTRTTGGKWWLEQLMHHPHTSIDAISSTQDFLKHIMRHHDEWPAVITNGTIMVLEKFYESQIDTIPKQASMLDATTYRLFHTHDFSLNKYTVGHAIDFFSGFKKLIELLSGECKSPVWMKLKNQAEALLGNPAIQQMIEVKAKQKLPAHRMLQFAHFILYRYKQQLHQLIDVYYQLDAYYSLATAVMQYQLVFPEITDSKSPFVEADELHHILLRKAVPYDIHLHQQSNFVFLTGANMAGKSTFIKAVGVAVYLAHLGMAVPAKMMRLSLFHGLLSNIQVQDNLTKGESYFYNEVKRIKNTIATINDGKPWLVLIDELFKGTNVQDAMRCSTVVIRGLLKIRKSLFILSTHLYEIAGDLNGADHISFRYFETSVEDGELKFNYQMKEGISNDRLGYLILKREGVVDMIDTL